MKPCLLFIACLVFGVTSAQSPAPQTSLDHLSEEEIKAAVNSKPGSGFVLIEDMGFSTPSNCQAQMPSEAIYTPAGWLNALSQGAKQQYLPFKPKENDTLKALTVISKGCASGTPSGPVCDSITRVAHLSDASGTTVVEAKLSYPLGSTWQNGYGAWTVCTSMVSKFSMEDVAKVRSAKGEFLIVTFSGPTLLKRYTVKQKHIKALGL